MSSMAQLCEHGDLHRHRIRLCEDSDHLPSNDCWYDCPGGRTLTVAETLELLLSETCDACRGSGDLVEEVWDSPPSRTVEQCPNCDGRKRVPADLSQDTITEAVLGRYLLAIASMNAKGDDDGNQ